jgi:hypothetical protein
VRPWLWNLTISVNNKARLFGWDEPRLKEMAALHMVKLMAAGPQQSTNNPPAPAS